MEKFKIQYSGGSTPVTKFHLFVIARGKEVFFSQLYNERDSGSMPEDFNGNPGLVYEVVHPHVKVFVQTAVNRETGRGKSYSFYFALSSDPYDNLVTISNPDNPNHFFQARGRFLKQAEAIKLLAKDSPSIYFIQSQRRPGREELRSLITIERVTLKIGGGRKFKLKPLNETDQ